MSGGNKQTEKQSATGDYSTEKAPGHVPILYAEMFRRAGITPFDELRARFGSDFNVMLEYIAEKRRQAADWRTALRAKAECGGALLVAKMFTEHGMKADLYASTTLNRNTVTAYIDIYKYGPWAWETLLGEEQKAIANGEIYSPTLEHVIRIGRTAAEAAGVSRKKATFTGIGTVLMIDPVSRTVAAVEMPAGFPGSKSVKPHWEKQDYELQAGGMPTSGRARSNIRSELWSEVGGNRSGYYEFDLPLRDSSAPRIKLRLTGRTLLMRAKAKEVLPPLPAEAIARLVDFDAREARKVGVFDIDPSTGGVIRSDILDNLIVEPNGSTKLTLLSATPLGGLTVVQQEPESLFAFSLAGQRFRGRSYLVRLDADSRWIAPLGVTTSAGELKQQITFNTLLAAAQESGERLPTTAGFEALTTALIKDYFDLTDREMISIINEHLGLGMSGTFQSHQNYVDAGLRFAGSNGWDVTKLRAIIAKVKPRRAETETRLRSEGFVEGPIRWEGDVGSEAANHAIMRRVLRLTPDTRLGAVHKAMEAAGFVQRVGDKMFSNGARLQPLVDAELARVQDGSAPLTRVELHPEDYVPEGYTVIDGNLLEIEGIPAADSEDQVLNMLSDEFGADNIEPYLNLFELGRQLGDGTIVWNIVRLRVFLRQIVEGAEPSDVPPDARNAGFIKFTPLSYGFEIDDLEQLVSTEEAERRGFEMTAGDGVTYLHPEKTIAFYEANKPKEQMPSEPAPALQEPDTAPPTPPADAATAAEADDAYEAMTYEDRELADRKLRDEIVGSLQLAERQVILARTELRSSTPADAMKPLETALAAVAAAERLVAALMERLDIAKSSVAEVTSVYFNTEQGRVNLYPRPAAVDEILKAYADKPTAKIINLVLTTPKGEVTLPTLPEGEANGGKTPRRRRGRQPNIH